MNRANIGTEQSIQGREKKKKSSPSWVRAGKRDRPHSNGRTDGGQFRAMVHRCFASALFARAVAAGGVAAGGAAGSQPVAHAKHAAAARQATNQTRLLPTEKAKKKKAKPRWGSEELSKSK